MRSFLVRLLAGAAGLAAAAWLLAGITIGAGQDEVQRAGTLLGVAAVFGVVNAVVKPVVKLLALPLLVLTLGLLTFVINALLLLLTERLSNALGLLVTVDGFGTALVGSLIVSVVGWAAALALD